MMVLFLRFLTCCALSCANTECCFEVLSPLVKRDCSVKPCVCGVQCPEVSSTVDEDADDSLGSRVLLWVFQDGFFVQRWYDFAAKVHELRFNSQVVAEQSSGDLVQAVAERAAAQAHEGKEFLSRMLDWILCDLEQSVEGDARWRVWRVFSSNLNDVVEGFSEDVCFVVYQGQEPTFMLKGSVLDEALCRFSIGVSDVMPYRMVGRLGNGGRVWRYSR